MTYIVLPKLVVRGTPVVSVRVVVIVDVVVVTLATTEVDTVVDKQVAV